MGPIHGEGLHKVLGDVTANVVAKETVIVDIIRNGKKQLVVAAKIVGAIVAVVVKDRLVRVAHKDAPDRSALKGPKVLWGKEGRKVLPDLPALLVQRVPPARPAQPALLV